MSRVELKYFRRDLIMFTGYVVTGFVVFGAGMALYVCIKVGLI